MHGHPENACRYTESGTVEIGLEAEQGFVTLLVKDTGIGIAPNTCRTCSNAFTGEMACGERMDLKANHIVQRMAPG